MRFCGGFLGRNQLACPKKRAETDAVARQFVASAFPAIADADRRAALGAGSAKRLNGLDRGPARRDDVLDEADPLARLEGSLDAVARPVLLGRLAHDHEREAGGQGCGRGERDGAELRSRETLCVRLVLADGGGETGGNRLEEVRAGLEPVLVEVVRRAAAGPQDEIAFEERVLAQRGLKLLIGHATTASSSRVSSSRSRASTPRSSRTPEPSSKTTFTWPVG